MITQLVPFECRCGAHILGEAPMPTNLVAHMREAFCARCNATTRQLYRVPTVGPRDPVLEAVLQHASEASVELLTDEEMARRDGETPRYDGYARRRR